MAAKATEAVKIAPDDTIIEARAALKRLRDGATFHDWVTLAKALAIGRAHALAAAANGTTYTAALRAWLRANGLADVKRQERHLALKLLDHLPEIEKWRGGLSEARRAKLSHPEAVLNAWRRSLPQPEAETKTAATTPNKSPLTIWPAAIRERTKRAVARAIDRYGSDAHHLTAAALAAALPRPADVTELLAAQTCTAARPAVKFRPRSPSAVVADTAALSLRP